MTHLSPPHLPPSAVPLAPPGAAGTLPERQARGASALASCVPGRAHFGTILSHTNLGVHWSHTLSLGPCTSTSSNLPNTSDLENSHSTGRAEGRVRHCGEMAEPTFGGARAASRLCHLLAMEASLRLALASSPVKRG